VTPKVSFSPDHQLLASIDREMVVLWNWNLGLDELLNQGCTWLGDYFENNPNVTEQDKQVCQGVEQS